jgi:hypothetical protein|tara:strand:- start:4496 stop:4621 length:126 start_codon:yes stop_codon:yes gene_type:complete
MGNTLKSFAPFQKEKRIIPFIQYDKSMTVQDKPDFGRGSTI